MSTVDSLLEHTRVTKKTQNNTIGVRSPDKQATYIIREFKDVIVWKPSDISNKHTCLQTLLFLGNKDIKKKQKCLSFSSCIQNRAPNFLHRSFALTFNSIAT